MPPRLTALRAVYLVALHHGLQIGPEKLQCAADVEPVAAILGLMSDAGLAGKLLRGKKWVDLAGLGSAIPALAEQKEGNWLIVASVVPNVDGSHSVAVLDPREEQRGLILKPRAEFEANWTGRLILCKRQYAQAEERQAFGLRWFMPEILRNKRYFRDVAIAALMATLISFSTPVFFNVLIDKVLPHHSYNTLYTLVAVYLAMLVFDSLFGYIRQYLMIFATNKIDANLASRTYDHLLRLPMHFFESSSAGVLARNMQQTESIRHFLTGRLFQIALDTVALPILLVGLALYSGKLTLVVLLFSLAIAVVIGLMIPAFRSQLERLYLAEGERQADLVETIRGVRAVKSLALEASRKNAWDRKVVNSVRRRGSVGTFGVIAGVITNALEKMMQITVLGLGAMDIFDGSISIGALVAFNMMSGRVTGPLIQIVAMINEYQQVALSVKMLGQVMDLAPERDANQHGIMPPITGDLVFDNVIFRYEGTVTPALNRVSFHITEGQMIGVVGRSGSGKTTVTRMIQGIHTPQEGLVQLNGNDIRHIDLRHLRRNVGMVLQDNILFRGTLRANIAAARPEASLEEVMEVARLAGADEFINRLPRSYETFVEENGANFSGGQRQRIAIARTLLTRPRLLIFDEATSALDPDSEAIIQDNLAEIAKGRTMIVVSHRLSSLAGADAIMVLDRGAVVDFAPHHTLLERCDIYRHLWNQQTRYAQ